MDIATRSLYFPPKGDDWETTSLADAGFDPARLSAAVDFAVRHESLMDRDIGSALHTHFSEPLPDGAILGPTKPREGPNGMILKDGRIVAEWGDTNRVDMTFSVAKSYLAILAGVAVDTGLIPDLSAPVGDLVKDGGFESPQNAGITWEHLLHQTSEWEGTLFDKPDMIDRNRSLATAPGAPSKKGTFRALQSPGTFWEYNDVRVNRLSLALLRVFGRALPEVLRDRVMGPIGASDTWEWHGYENSWVEIGGARVQSVSGGAHWGGGIFISTRDHARIGLLMANSGQWDGRAVLPETYVNQALRPCPLKADYGYLWWLNTDRTQSPSAPTTSFFAKGVGANIIWCDPALGLVAVIRWLDRDSLDGFVSRVLSAMR